MLLVFASCSMYSYGQKIPVYPIPSSQVPVNGNAIFSQDIQGTAITPTEGKKEIKVQVNSVAGLPNCQATVWIYTLDRTTILGPYIVNCGETLTVEIDDREWGVLVESENDILVDVWTSP